MSRHRTNNNSRKSTIKLEWRAATGKSLKNTIKLNKDMIPFLIDHLSVFLTGIASGATGWIFGKKRLEAEVRKLRAEISTNEIENKGKLITIYREAIDDLSIRYEKKYREVTELYEKKIRFLHDVINQLKKEISALKEK